MVFDCAVPVFRVGFRGFPKGMKDLGALLVLLVASFPGVGQKSLPTPSDAALKIVILGSGAGPPADTERYGPSILVEAGGGTGGKRRCRKQVPLPPTGLIARRRQRKLVPVCWLSGVLVGCVLHRPAVQISRVLAIQLGGA